MAAHDVNPILSYLDQVIYLAPGGTVSGPPEQVVTGETLTRLYRTPIEVLRCQRRAARRGRRARAGRPGTATGTPAGSDDDRAHATAAARRQLGAGRTC